MNNEIRLEGNKVMDIAFINKERTVIRIYFDDTNIIDCKILE